MSKLSYVPLLIPGHGGIDPKTGLYTTAPAKMVRFGDGKEIYEGVENRLIAEAVVKCAAEHQIKAVNLLQDEWRDISHRERVKRIGLAKIEFGNQGYKCYGWENHLNAFQINKAQGFEVWTTRKKNFSDVLATHTYYAFRDHLPSLVMRPDWSDGDPDKEKDFNVITWSDIFICLPELYFFDRREEVEMYANPDGRWAIAEAFVDSFKRVEEVLQAA